MAVRSGGRLVAEALLGHGVEHVFCVPGESYLPVLDALYEETGRVQVVTCRHEGGAIVMAEATGKLTGRPGVCMVTRGPGACNAAIGVHTAYQDSTPLVLLVGQVRRGFQGRDSFQEIDYRRMFQPISKWVAHAENAGQLPELMAQAFRTATTGRPGPVVLALPEDVLHETSEVDARSPVDLHPSHPGPGAMERLRHMLGDAERPVMLVGGSSWSDAARRDVIAFAEANDIPTCCSFRRNDIFDNGHRNFVGELGYDADPALIERVRQADLILAVGTRLSQVATQGYTLIHRGQAIVQVHPDADELGRIFHPALVIQSGMEEFAAAAAGLAPVGHQRWEVWSIEASREQTAHRNHPPVSAVLDMGVVMSELDARLPDDAIVTVDAGNFTFWPQRFLRFGGGRRLLGAVNGAMGYGTPSAVAAKLAAPSRAVIGFAGDGGFGMTGMELATAVQFGAAPILMVVNNGMLGTIRMHQERLYPGRTMATTLTNPNFAALARACGAHGETVERTEEFVPAFERAQAAGIAAVIEFKTDPEVITTRTTLTAIREGAEVEPEPEGD